MYAQDLDVFFTGLDAASCTANGFGFRGLLDTPDESLNQFGVNVLSTMYVLTCKSSDVASAGIASGAAITVGAAAYVVRDVMLVDDGAITHLTLSK